MVECQFWMYHEESKPQGELFVVSGNTAEEAEDAKKKKIAELKKGKWVDGPNKFTSDDKKKVASPQFKPV